MMGRSKGRSTSKIKLSNKSANKHIRKKPKNKLEKQSQQKTVKQPLLKQNAKKNTNVTMDHSAFEEDFEDADVTLSDDEITDFVSNNTASLSFLSADYASDNVRNKKRKADNGIAEYEKVPRLLSDIKDSNINNNKVNLLPIKSDKGIIMRSIEKEVDTVENDQVLVEDEETEKKDEQEPVTLVQLMIQTQHDVDEKKLKVAQLSQSIIEDPEGNISSLKQLLLLSSKSEMTPVRKLAILSLLEVFKDIIPSYRLRELSTEEKAAKVSRDVRKLRDFEENLLSSYQKYLQMLEQVIQDCLKLLKKKRKIGLSESTEIAMKTFQSMTLLSIKCLSQLLKTVPHFNFRANIVSVLVQNIQVPQEIVVAGNICADSIKYMLRNDTTGEVSLEIIKVIHRITKTKSNLNPKVLETLLSLRINSEIIQSASTRGNKIERLKAKQEAIRKMSKKERKRKKIEERLNKELQEVEAVESSDKIEKLQTEILKFLFVIYFRILKFDVGTALLVPVLKGLSQFAHLINVEFFEDLMSSIQKLLQSQKLGVNERLSCVLTALKILSGQGESLNIDPRQFYTELYNILMHISTGCNDVDIQLLKRCLDVMLIKRRKQVSLQQVLGFLKRITTLLLQMDTEGVFDYILFVRSLLQLHPKCDYLLDNEDFGRGVFRQDAVQPELANADSTALWELLLLWKHYHPQMSTYCNHLINGAPSHGNGSLPTKFQQRKVTMDSLANNDDDDVSMYFIENIPSELSKKTKSRKHLDHLLSDHFSSFITAQLEQIGKCEQEFFARNT